MKNFFVRAASAIVYAGLLICGSLFWTPLLYLTFAMFFVVALFELKQLLKTDIDDVLFVLWGFICLLFLLIPIAASDSDIIHLFEPDNFLQSILLVFTPFALFFIVVILSVLSRRSSGGLMSFFAVSIIYLLIPFVFFIVLQNVFIADGLPTLLFILAAIWINDTMAYITGSLIGKHKLVERISPGKTWEGFIGGLIFTIGIMLLANALFFDFDIATLAVVSLVIVISGTLGDLLESKLKREAGVKDSGSFIPGHGGILDRLDSLLLAAPFAGIAFMIINWVNVWIQ